MSNSRRLHWRGTVTLPSPAPNYARRSKEIYKYFLISTGRLHSTSDSRRRRRVRDRVRQQRGLALPLQALSGLKGALHLVSRSLADSQRVPVHLGEGNCQGLEEVDPALREKHEITSNERNSDDSSAHLWLWRLQDLVARGKPFINLATLP